MKLYGYFRSTASWRVRIALALKGIDHEVATLHLRRGEQRESAYLALNPQGLVPALVLDDGTVLTQSLAICEYLDEVFPEPALLPPNPIERARVRAFCAVIASDIHPIQNLKILQRLRSIGVDEEGRNAWARATIEEGFEACAQLLADRKATRFAFGESPGLADLVLVPQMANARRFGVELRWPRLLEIEAACREHPAFSAATPERQPDAE